jgi:ribosome-binding protein aMBF1 (putative translation factor)
LGKILRSVPDMALRAMLIEARVAKGLTQEQLARRLNKPQSYVWSEFSERYATLLRMQAMPVRKRRKLKQDGDS